MLFSPEMWLITNDKVLPPVYMPMQLYVIHLLLRWETSVERLIQ